MEHYVAALKYRDMVVGIGLDSLEVNRPPMMFQEVFALAQKDGFRITAHCDVGKAYPVEHIRQVVSEIGCNGGDRIDHGLNAVDSPELMDLIHQKGLGMTICPWSYIRHQPLDDVFSRIRTLFDAGIRLAIASDDPAFMEDTWIQENFLVLKSCSNFSNEGIQKLAKDAVEISWAPEQVKKDILDELYRIDTSSSKPR
jgi:adenosine deaminase